MKKKIIITITILLLLLSKNIKAAELYLGDQIYDTEVSFSLSNVVYNANEKTLKLTNYKGTTIKTNDILKVVVLGERNELTSTTNSAIHARTLMIDGDGTIKLNAPYGLRAKSLTINNTNIRGGEYVEDLITDAGTIKIINANIELENNSYFIDYTDNVTIKDSTLKLINSKGIKGAAIVSLQNTNLTGHFKNTFIYNKATLEIIDSEINITSENSIIGSSSYIIKDDYIAIIDNKEVKNGDLEHSTGLIITKEENQEPIAKEESKEITNEIEEQNKEEIVTNLENQEPTHHNPQTGDNINKYYNISIILASIISITLLLFLGIKRWIN